MPDLFPLIKLHRVDVAIVEIRRRAAAWDPGRALSAEIQRLTDLIEAAQKEHQHRQATVTDLELRQKTLRDKLAKFDKDLYGGNVVNPREVEAIQKEMELLKKHISDLDGDILEAIERVPEAEADLPQLRKELEIRQRQLADHQKKAHEEKAKMEAEFKELSSQRPSIESKVDPGLLKQYDAIRKRYDGIGMSEITPSGTCARCGVQVPSKSIVMAKEGKLVTCDACHRLLYKLEG
ncbi:MAG: hypothetical protein HONBIEJF_01954 [Fimbriimonadaceae bacterium]|nr:hypothetical protein [Fimbriimonadaceae bacterium]